MENEKKHILGAKIDKSQIRKVYGKIAPSFDLWGKLTESKARKRCLELAAIEDGDSILEIAVGTGLAFTEILKMNPNGRNEGIDLTEEMLIRARKKADATGVSNYRLSIGDAYKLDYSDNAFDVLINNYMFDLLPEEDFRLVLGEFIRVLRTGGRLVMVNMTQRIYWYHSIWEMIYRLNPELIGGCRGVYLLPYLDDLGFENITREFVSQMTFPSEVVYGTKPNDH